MTAGLGEDALAGLLAGYGVAVPVGAIAALLVNLAARTGPRVGAAAALGVATADGLYCAVAVTGGTAAARTVAPIAEPLRWAACAVLLGLAAKTAWTAHTTWQRRHTAQPAPRRGLDTPARAYLGLLALTALNPSTIIYFTALVLGRQATPGLLPATVYVTAAFAASASWQLLLAAGGGLLGRTLTGPRGRYATATGSSAVIAALAIALVA